MKLFPDIPGIYAIINRINGKQYIGSTVNINKRLIEHRYGLNANRHFNQHLQRAWNKYGEEAFEFKVLKTCLINELLDIEQDWIDNEENLYNICPSAHSTLGRELTEEHKKKISQTNMGHPVTDKMRKKFKQNYASNDKIKEYIQSKKGDSEYWESIGFTWKGKKHSEESKKKMSKSAKGRTSPNKGKPIHPNAKAALLKANLGSKHSEEHKRKISEGNKGIIRNNKLTETDVAEIRNLCISKKYSQPEIARMFNVNQSVISRIKNGKAWTNYKIILA